MDFSSVQVHWSSKWARGQENFREKLQETMWRLALGGFGSVSYGEGVGGFAVAACEIGFDLEPLSRTVPIRTLKRVSTDAPRELMGAPSHLALWCAKEAAFKVPQNKNPGVLSDILVDFVPANSTHFTAYNLRQGTRLIGITWARAGFQMAIAQFYRRESRCCATFPG